MGHFPEFQSDLNAIFDTLSAQPYAFDTTEKLFVELMAAMMKFYEDNGYMMRRDFDGMVKLTREALAKHDATEGGG